MKINRFKILDLCKTRKKGKKIKNKKTTKTRYRLFQNPNTPSSALHSTERYYKIKGNREKKGKVEEGDNGCRRAFIEENSTH